MVGHFLSRDVRDFSLWWISLGIVSLGFAASSIVVPWRQRIDLLLLAYFLFGFLPSAQVLGSVWRTQHQWSRHYLLALPLSHTRLLAIQHARLLVFWLPLLLVSTVMPAVTPRAWTRFTVLDWSLYYGGVVVSVGLLMQLAIWSTLEHERISTYVPKAQRLWAWVKMFGVIYGLMAVLGTAWVDLLLDPASRRHQGLLGWLYWPGASRVIFPAGCLLALFWVRRNARRWCVTL